MKTTSKIAVTGLLALVACGGEQEKVVTPQTNQNYSTYVALPIEQDPKPQEFSTRHTRSKYPGFTFTGKTDLKKRDFVFEEYGFKRVFQLADGRQIVEQPVGAYLINNANKLLSQKGQFISKTLEGIQITNGALKQPIKGINLTTFDDIFDENKTLFDAIKKPRIVLREIYNSGDTLRNPSELSLMDLTEAMNQRETAKRQFFDLKRDVRARGRAVHYELMVLAELTAEGIFERKEDGLYAKLKDEK